MMSRFVSVFLAVAAFGSSSASALTRYELSLFQACETVNDCVAVNKGHCDCHNGGGNVGINKEQQSAFEATFKGNHGCTEIGGMHPCDEGELQCNEGLCHWQWAHAGVPPTCQTTSEVLVAADDALSEEDLAPFQECVHDLQCISVVNKGSCDRNMIGEEVAINSANRTDFRDAFSNTQATCSARNEEYIWGIGTAECELGKCEYTPAPRCGNDGLAALDDSGAATNPIYITVVSAALLLTASWT